jgi:hypothetical protein
MIFPSVCLLALPSLVAATRLSVQMVSATTGDSISGAECAFFSRGSIMEGEGSVFPKETSYHRIGVFLFQKDSVRVSTHSK